MSPVPTGSIAAGWTIGVVVLAFLAARAAGVVTTMMTSTFSRTISAANSLNRSTRPSAYRPSKMIFCPSTYPSSRRPANNALVPVCEESDSPNLFRRLRVGGERPCCRSHKQYDELTTPHVGHGLPSCRGARRSLSLSPTRREVPGQLFWMEGGYCHAVLSPNWGYQHDTRLSAGRCPPWVDAVEKVGDGAPARNNRIASDDFLNRTFAFGGCLESILFTGPPQNPFSTASVKPGHGGEVRCMTAF